MGIRHMIIVFVTKVFIFVNILCFKIMIPAIGKPALRDAEITFAFA